MNPILEYVCSHGLRVGGSGGTLYPGLRVPELMGPRRTLINAHPSTCSNTQVVVDLCDTQVVV